MIARPKPWPDPKWTQTLEQKKAAAAETDQ